MLVAVAGPEATFLNSIIVLELWHFLYLAQTSIESPNR